MISSAYPAGRQCLLADMTLAYLEAHVQALSDPEVTRYLRIRKPVTLEHQKLWMTRVLGSSSDALFAILTPTGEYIGAAHLRDIDRQYDMTAHSGIVIGRAFWGRGIGTEARMLQLRYAFKDLGLRWIFGQAAAPNIASQRLLERCGYQRQGVRPFARWLDGAFHDDYLYGVSRDAWHVAWRAWRSTMLGAADP